MAAAAPLFYDGKNDADEDVPAGNYIFTLQTKNSTESKTMVLKR